MRPARFINARDRNTLFQLAALGLAVSFIMVVAV